MWSPTEGNLLYPFLGATPLLVADTFQFKDFET